jgi:hypothetical protein
MRDEHYGAQNSTKIVQPRGNGNGIIFCANLCCTKQFCATLLIVNGQTNSVVTMQEPSPEDGAQKEIVMPNKYQMKKSSVFWDITPCSPLKVNQRFGGTSRLHLQGRSISQARNQLPASCWLFGLLFDPED